MKITIVTIALDAMPFVTLHYPEFRKLKSDWEWLVAEGVAAPVLDTSWVSKMAPRLSQDGTTEYLDSVRAFDSRVHVFRRSEWPGKAAMFNRILETIYEPTILLQVDSDECWTAEQIEALVAMFQRDRSKNSAYFYCRYFVGRDLVIATRNGFGNHTEYEWLRAWRFVPGMRFERHEPPVIDGLTLNPFTHAETESEGIVFDHFAYATEAQVRFKQEYYGSHNNPKGHLYTGL